MRTTQAVYNVPNVPCGVESRFAENSVFEAILFLMYRVELKDYWVFINFFRGDGS